MSQAGAFQQTDYFENSGGVNVTDSPFMVKSTQATGGVNFEYPQAGGIQKRRGPTKINRVADATLNAHGMSLFETPAGVKTVIRAAGAKIQAVDVDALTFTNLTEDSLTASSSVFSATTTAPTAFAQFNTVTNSLLAFAGALTRPYAVYSGTKFTKLGSDPATGSISATPSLTGGAFAATGTYFYSVVLRKASTQALSNAGLDTSATIANTTDKVTVSLVGLTGLDATKYDQVWIYRSAVSGVTGFTTGSLIAQVSSAVTSYVDTGTNILTAQNVPRAASTVLDNGVLPDGTYGAITTWKRRLVTATGSTLYYSDLNAPESWPSTNKITIPSGGPITALAVISFNTDYGNDEYLAVFKENELWLVRGTTYTDITLSFVDRVGCPNQSLLCYANGFLAWMDVRGVYIWDGSGKPIYVSRPIEALFAVDGDINKAELPLGYCTYFRKKNIVEWFVSSRTYGSQYFSIKMDLRLTLPSVTTQLAGRVVDGVFNFNKYVNPVYGVMTYLPTSSNEESEILADNAGFVYAGYQAFNEASSAIDFQYYTPFLDLGNPNVAKRYHKVVVWVDAVGTWNLTLNYWAGYRAAIADASTVSSPINSALNQNSALWDAGIWDNSYWDDYTSRLTPIVFNLNSVGGNSEGDCIRLKFSNNGADQPVTIYGYSVVWSSIAMRK